MDVGMFVALATSVCVHSEIQTHTVLLRATERQCGTVYPVTEKQRQRKWEDFFVKVRLVH